MSNIVKELNTYICKDHVHYFDPEDPNGPNSFNTCLEEKKYLLKSFQQRRYFGRHIPLLWINNEPYFTLGPHWPLFLITWCGLVGIGMFIIIHIPGNKFPILKISVILATIWQAFIYLLTALKNPGIVSVKDINDPALLHHANQPNFCKVCKILGNRDIRHCAKCKVCIRGYDHHCPWTGKCIGSGNWCQFYSFLFTTAFYITFCMIAAVSLFSQHIIKQFIGYKFKMIQ